MKDMRISTPKIFRRTIGKFNLLIIGFICLLLGAAVAGGFALSFESKIQSTATLSTSVPLKSETGMTQFWVKSAQPLNTTAISFSLVAVFCTVNSTNLAQNEPSLITVKVMFENISNVDIDTMVVYPLNTINLFNASYSEKTGITYVPMQPPTSSVLYPTPSASSDIPYWETWEANGGVIFQNSGQVSLEVNLYVKPIADSGVNLTSFQSAYDLTLPIPDVTINSGQSVQKAINQNLQNTEQANSNNMNLSIASFVALFALLDIAFVCYDHTIDKDKAKEREDKQNYRERLERVEETIDY
jgi:hypothetical protein